MATAVLWLTDGGPGGGEQLRMEDVSRTEQEGIAGVLEAGVTLSSEEEFKK